MYTQAKIKIYFNLISFVPVLQGVMVIQQIT